MKFYVYKIIKEDTGEFYIGSKVSNSNLYFRGFGSNYKTSSSIVNEIGFEKFSLVYFNDNFENYQDCYDFEQLLIKENLTNPLCLNQACFVGKDGHPYRMHKYGHKTSDETRKKIANSKRGVKRISYPRKPLSEETKQKIKDARNKNPKRPHVSELNKKRIKCVHCSREFSPGNFANHHGDKCKFKLATIDISS